MSFLRPIPVYILLCLAQIAFLAGCQTTSRPPTQVSEAVPLVIPPVHSREEASPEKKVDYIVVQKKDRLLSLWKDGRILRTFSIMAMGANPVGQKVYEGDERTPEGQYEISEKHVSQNFQKFLLISYPNEHDKAMAKRFGIPPGGQVGIHGDRGGVSGFFQRFDKSWTDGCLALRNKDVEEVYEMVEVGTPILIKP